MVIKEQWLINFKIILTIYLLTIRKCIKKMYNLMAVSYTHLDVYKRQVYTNHPHSGGWFLMLA